jgi:glycerol transport system substrate-binding protein
MASAAAMVAVTVTLASPVRADDATIQKWIDSEFQPSTLSKADQKKELEWFAKAAEPFKGMEINVV